MNETVESKKVSEMIKDFYEKKSYGEIVIKIEAGKIVRFEKKESVKI